MTAPRSELVSGSSFDTADLDRPRHLVGLSAWLARVSRIAAVAAIAVGVVALLGYIFRWTWAVQIHRSLPPMYPNTALGFTIGGFAALSVTHQRRSDRGLGLAGFMIVGVCAAITLMLHALDLGSTLLEGLWPDHPVVAATTEVAGRPVAETCVSFLCIGVAGVLLALRRAPRLSQGLALGTVCVGVAATFGFLIGVDRRALGSSFVLFGMAIHTAIGLVTLGLAVLLAQPTLGLFGRLTRTGPSAQLGRRLVAAVVVAPIVLTAVTTTLVRMLPDARLAQSVAAILQIVSLGLLVMLPLGSAERVEIAANEALFEARRLREEAGERDVVIAAITDVLLDPPTAPPGWDLGFRQSAAFASLPGDSCQVLTAPDGRCLVAVIDVAGHGTGPALQALHLRTTIAALHRTGQSLASITNVVNESVHQLDTIATGVLMLLDPAAGTIEFVNAGHPPAYVATAHGIERWARTQPIFGFAHGCHGTEQRWLERGSFLVVYTDGVSEARNESHQPLGEQAIEQALRRHSASGAQAVADTCIDTALSHARARLCDDALVLVLHRA
ncbi:MAG: PP2C family protein-serine/threonine phosphatase [Ilumatobacteraceae bacterium]